MAGSGVGGGRGRSEGGEGGDAGGGRIDLREVLAELVDNAKSHGEAAEAFGLERDEWTARFEANRLKLVQKRSALGAGLRLIRGGRLGFACGTAIDEPEGRARIIRGAVEAAGIGGPAPFGFPGPAAPTPVACYDEGVAGLGAAELAEIGTGIVGRLAASDEAVLCEITLSRTVDTVALVNSSGYGGCYRRTSLSMGLEATRISGTDILAVFDEYDGRRNTLDPGATASETAERLARAKVITEVPTRIMPVVFAPRALYAVLMFLQDGLSARTVLQGASRFTEALGRKVFDNRLTVIDDATVPYAANCAPFDDEGVPTKPIVLVREGVPQSYYYDLVTAGLMPAAGPGAEGGREARTANGFRPRGAAPEYEAEPVPALTNVLVEAGDVPYERMLQDVGDGLLVEQVMGAGQSNVLRGDFSMNVHLGFRIHHGRIAGRVKDTMVAGNSFDAFKDVIALSRERQWTRGLLCPAVAFRSLGVSSGG